MNYNQFWNNNEIEEVQKDVNWEDEFDIDETEDNQEEMNYSDYSDCESCSFLSEQEETEDPDIYEEIQDSESEEEMIDDSLQYSVSSLFDYDEEEQVEEPVEELSAEEQPVEEQLVEEQEEEQEEEQFTEDLPVMELNTFEEPVEEPVVEPVFDTPVEELSAEEQPVEEQPVEKQTVVEQEEDPETAYLPPVLKSVFTFVPSYSYFGTYLKTLSEGDLWDIEAYIEKTKQAWLNDKKEKMFNIPGSNISIAVLNDVDDPLTLKQRKQSLGVQMFAAEESKWNCLDLFFEKDGTLKKAVIEEVTQDSFEDWQWKTIQSVGFELWKSRQK